MTNFLASFQHEIIDLISLEIKHKKYKKRATKKLLKF